MEKQLALILDKLGEFDGIRGELNGIHQKLGELDGIRSELDGIKTELQTIKSQLNENTALTKAVRDRQEESDAKFDSLAMDVHKLHGTVVSLKENTENISSEIADIRGELAYASHKSHRNEVEIFKLRREQAMESGNHES